MTKRRQKDGSSAHLGSASALCFLFGIVAHFPALFGDFVLDEFSLLVENPHLRHLDGLKILVTSRFFDAVAEPISAPYYRPLSGAFYWISYQLLGTSPLLHHALNLLLHGGVTALAFRLLVQLGTSRHLALFLALLFAAHPATADIVAYSAGRQELMGWLLVFVLMRPFLQGWTRQNHTLVFALAAGSVLFGAFLREYFLVAPALLFCAALAAGARIKGKGSLLSAFLAGTTCGVLLLLGARSAVQATLDREPLTLADLSHGVAGSLYRLLGITVFPHDLSVEVTPPEWPLAVNLLISVLGLAGAVYLATRFIPGEKRTARPGLLGLVIISSVVLVHAPSLPIFGLFTDRYGYGFVLGSAFLLADPLQVRTQSLAKWWRDRVPASLRNCYFLLVFLPLPATWIRDLDYESDQSLAMAMYRERPDDPLSWEKEGWRRFEAKDFGSALPLCEKWLAARPHAPRALNCTAVSLGELRRTEEAISHLEKAAKHNPNDPRICTTLGQVVLRDRGARQARTYLEQRQQWDPSSPCTQALSQYLIQAEAVLQRANAP